MAINLAGYFSGGSGGVFLLMKWIFYAVFIGGLVGIVAVLIIRWLMFLKYRVITIEKRASGAIAIGVDKLRNAKKKGEMKTIFANRRESMEQIPIRHLYPTIKKGIFDIFAPKETLITFSYNKGEHIPTDIVEELNKFIFKPRDAGVEAWGMMERKAVAAKHNQDPFWKTPQFMMLSLTGAWLMGLVLMIVFFKS